MLAAVDSRTTHHWAFERFKSPPAPVPNDDKWPKTAIDRFVRARQESLGLFPNPPIERAKLIRRLHYDVIGLPPSPEQVEAFVLDTNPGALEKVIDRLLASSHYGERWGRHWLDVARYADSMGYRYDDNTPWAFQYRDFVIKALNQDMTFDTFVSWQIAGDELAPENPLALAATGFCAVGPRERTEGTKRIACKADMTSWRPPLRAVLVYESALRRPYRNSF